MPLALVVALICTGACSGTSTDDNTRRASAPTTSPPAEPATSTTTTTTPLNPTKLPEDARATSAAYAQAVLDALYLRFREATAEARQRNAFDEPVLAKLDAVYAPGHAQAFVDDVQRSGGPSALSASPGRVELRVNRVEDSSGTCILVSTRIDLSKLLVEPLSPSDPFFIRLERKTDAQAGDVPWRIGANYTKTDNKPYDEDRCHR